jgi:colanic acid/amylovoran biosynthesis glycosyltransferase
MPKSNIIIFRDPLLAPSETFIRAQGESLAAFRAYYAGLRRVSGLDLPADRLLLQNADTLLGRLPEALFKTAGLDLTLSRRLRAVNPLLVHAHFGPSGVLAMTLARKLRVPLIVTFHGYDATVSDRYLRQASFSQRRYLRRRRALQRQASLFIAVSDFIRGKLLEQGFPESKVVRHYIGIDLDYFQPDMSLPREPVVLFVGRLVAKKGCAYLIRAMQRVEQSHPAAELVVIGDGPLRRELELLAASLLPRCRFLGSQPPGVVRQWLNRASVFSVPSLTSESGDAEGFGMVFAEANAMGVPVASFASGGVPEAVAHNETGLLAPEGDWEELAANIGRLLADDALRQRLSRQGIGRVHRLFDIGRQTRLLEEIYRQTLQSQLQPDAAAAGNPEAGLPDAGAEAGY